MDWISMLTFLLTLVWLSASQAQDPSYTNLISDKEKARIEEQLHDLYWELDNDTYSKEVPDRYRDAEAVVLDHKVSKEYYRYSRNYMRTINFERKVILIQDRKGIQKNSVFTYQHIDSDFAFDVTAVRIIKPDGSEKAIALDSIMITKSYDKVEYRKFVIPGLQVGDILDFYYYVEFRVLFPQQYSRVFDPVYWLPQGDYPILDYHLDFTLGPSAYLNASTHLLPEFTSYNYKVDKKTFSKFQLNLSMLDPINLDLPWYYPFRELPNLRYQVFVGPYTGNTDNIYNLGGSLKMNTEIQHSRLQDFMTFSLTTGRDDRRHFAAFMQYLRKNGLKSKRMQAYEMALNYYYFVRCSMEYEQIIGKGSRSDAYQFISRANFVFDQLNIGRDILLAFDRSLTNIDQFVLSDEISPLMLVIEGDTSIMINPLPHRLPYEIDPKFERLDAFVFDPKNNRLDQRYLPGSVALDNALEIQLEASLNPIDGQLEVVKRYSATGHQKRDWQHQLINLPAMFSNRDIPAYKHYMDYRYPKRKMAQHANQSLEALARTRETEISEAVTDILDLDREAVSELDWNVSAPGNYASYRLTGNSSPFEWEASYIMDDVISQAAASFLLSIEDLVGSAGFPEELATSREADYYLDYPKAVNYSIRFIPVEGFSFGEYDQMAKTIDNKVGKFSSTAQLEGNTLVVQCSYELNHTHIAKEDSGLLVNILDAVREFTSAKVLYRRAE